MPFVKGRAVVFIGESRNRNDFELGKEGLFPNRNFGLGKGVGCSQEVKHAASVPSGPVKGSQKQFVDGAGSNYRRARAKCPAVCFSQIIPGFGQGESFLCLGGKDTSKVECHKAKMGKESETGSHFVITSRARVLSLATPKDEVSFLLPFVFPQLKN